MDSDRYSAAILELIRRTSTCLPRDMEDVLALGRKFEAARSPVLHLIHCRYGAFRQ